LLLDRGGGRGTIGARERKERKGGDKRPEGLTLTLPRDTAKPSPLVLNGLLVFRDSAAPA
jgi:hypothetical protein